MSRWMGQTVRLVGACSLLTGLASAQVTQDNSCGAKNHGWVCNPSDPLGGACCSQYGFCGNSPAFCGTGCQPEYGACDSVGGNGPWDVPNVGNFTHMANYTFQGLTQLPDGLYASNYTVAEKPPAKYGRWFKPENVGFDGKYLTLKVPGGQTSDPNTGAEVGTVENKMLYASVRVKAILCGEPGVVSGHFFMWRVEKNGVVNSQEIDIEYLPEKTSKSNPPNMDPPLQYTNHNITNGNATSTHDIAKAPTDVGTGEHEYRIDWLPGRVDFFTDGVQKASFNTNVPNTPGSWLFNIWSNGDEGWTVGPPKDDAVYKIRSVLMYYNTTSA